MRKEVDPNEGINEGSRHYTFFHSSCDGKVIGVLKRRNRTKIVSHYVGISDQIMAIATVRAPLLRPAGRMNRQFGSYS